MIGGISPGSTAVPAVAFGVPPNAPAARQRPLAPNSARRRFSPFAILVLIATSAVSAEISTIAGTGVKGFSGDGGPAAKAQLNNPFGLVRGPDGALYVCDTDNQRIRKISPDGIIRTVAGNGTRGYAGDRGPATEAALNEPYEVRFDSAGNLFFVERMNHLVRRVDAASGLISTIAGTGTPGFSGDAGPAAKAQLHEPHSIGFDPAGDLFICDLKNHRVRKVEMKTGTISTFAGTGEMKATRDGARFATEPLKGPRALDFDAAGNLWLALREGNAIHRLDLARGTLHHAAGAGGKPGFSGNGGPARAAILGGPKGVSIAPDGNIWFADTESHSVRMLDLQKGTVELAAGTGSKNVSASDGPADPLACALARPHGVFVDRDGAVYIGDSESHRIRVLRP